MSWEGAMPNQVILATGGYDHTIRLWQAHSGVCQRTMQHPDSQVNAMEITPDRQLLAAAGYQHIRMYDINSNNPNSVVNYENVSKNVMAVGFQEDGRWMFTGGEDCCARIWDLRSRTLQCQRIFQANHPVNCVCLHPNQAGLFIGDQSGIIHFWDLRTDHDEQFETETDASVQHIDIDLEGICMAAVDNKGNCYLYGLAQGIDTHTSQLASRLKLLAHKRYALKCKFSPDSTLLVTTSADTSAKVWRTADLKPLLEQKDLNGSTQLWEPSLHTNTSKVWKVADETTPMVELKDTNNSRGWVWDIAFSADSQYLVTASSDNLTRLWNVITGEVKREYSGHQKAVTALAFRDGA